MLDRAIVATVDGEEMTFRTDIKKLEKDDTLVVNVNGEQKIGIFVRAIDECDYYIKDIAFQKVDLNKFNEAVEKERIRITKEFKETCIKNDAIIVSEEIDAYLRECGFNCVNNKFLRNINKVGISISLQGSSILIEVAALKERMSNSAIVKNNDIVEIIKVINKNLIFMS
ncbi:hypothetical protein IC213_18885 [Clostridioides sp. ES-S-0049-02]|uniref:hypothetical protein n=1 Tax=Clostridioides sp. ES-S-0049-02 TaxID=2770778 RepID=UPI001D107E73|nr:hypothetical protein [Clostridioides sp. ES-S-0049-02]